MVTSRVPGCALLLVLVMATSAVAWQQPKPPPPQLSYLEGLARRPYSVAISPDGRTVLAGSIDGTIGVWDRRTGKPVRMFSAAPGTVLGLSIARSGNIFAAAAIDGPVRLFDLPRRFPLAELTGLPGDPTCLAISPDGRLAVSGDSSRVVRVWDLVGKKALRDLGGHAAPITGVVFLVQSRTVLAAAADGALRGWLFSNGESQGLVQTAPLTALAAGPEGRRLALAGADGLVRLAGWPPVPPQQLVQHAGTVRAVAVTPDGRLVASGGEGLQLHLFDGATGKSLRSLVGQVAPLTALDVDPGGTLVASGSAAGAWRAWVAGDGKPRPGRGGHVGEIHAVALHDKPPRLATAGADGTVRIWTLPDLSRGLFGHKMSVTAIAVTDDGKTLLTGSTDKTLQTWTIADGKGGRGVAAGSQPVSSVAIAGDGSRLARGDTAGMLHLEAAADGAGGLDLGAHTGAVTGIAMLPGGKQLVTSGADGTVKTWTPVAPPQAKFPPHAGPVTALAVAADGKRLATGGGDGSVSLLSAAGAPLRKLAGPASPVTRLTFSRNSAIIAAGNKTGQVRLWNANTGEVLGTLAAHKGAVTGLAIHSDGKQLVTAGADGAWKRWMLPLPEKGAMPAAMAVAHAGGVTALGLSADGAQIVTGGADKQVRLFTLAGAAVRAFAGHAGAVTAVAVSKDRVVAAGDDKTLRSWTRGNGAAGAVTTLPQKAVALAMDATGRRIAAAVADGTVRVVDLATGRELERFAGHPGAIQVVAWSGAATLLSGGGKSWRAAAVSATAVFVADATRVHDLALLPDGKHVVTAGEDRTVKQWTLAGKLVRSFGTLAAPVLHVSVSPDGKTVAAGGDPLATQKEARAWSVADGKQLCAVVVPAGVTAVGLCGNTRLAVAASDKSLSWFQVAGGRLLETTSIQAVATGLVSTPDGSTVALASADNNTWLLTPALEHLLVGHTGAVHGVAFTADGGWVLSGGADKTIRQWDAGTGMPTRVYTGSAAAVLALDVSADGKRLVAATADNRLLGWPLKADGARAAVAGDLAIATGGAVADVAVSGDGAVLAAAGANNQVTLWHAASGKLLERLAGHSGPPRSVAMTADGRRVFSGGNDKNTFRFTPSVSTAWIAHPSAIHTLAFTPDGKQLLTGGEDKRVARWMVPQGQPVNEYPGSGGPVRSLAVSGDGMLVVAGGDDKVLRTWSLAEGKPLASATLPSAVRGVCLDQAGTTLVAAGDLIVHQFQVTTVDGKPRLVPNQAGHGHTKPTTAVALAAGNRGLVSVGLDRTLRHWYSAAGPARATLAGHKGPVYGVAFSPDNKLLASAGGDRTVRVWNLENNESIGTFKGHQHQVTGVVFNPAVRQLVSTSLDGTLRIWPLEKGEVRVTDEGIEGGLLGVAITPNGNGISIVGRDRRWRLLNRGTLKPVRDMPGHNHAVYAVAFNGAGNRAVTIDYSGKLFLWDTTNGNIRFHQQLPVTRTTSLAFAPDGSEVFVAGQDKRVVRVLIPPPVR